MTQASTERPVTASYRAARDLLLTHRDDRVSALAAFEWPDLTGPFNWAHDWFDVVATSPETAQRDALRIVEEDGTTISLTYDAMRRRSNQVAHWLAEQGVSRGDSVLVMLGNQVELWETLLGVMKLGAVALPTTTAVGPADITDRLQRGQARFVIANAADTQKFAHLEAGMITGVAIGADTPTGWLDFAATADNSTDPLPHPGTEAHDTLLLYFTSGTTSLPKLVEHTQVSYPLGHLTTMYWIGLRPGDVHLNISSPGWAKHVWSSFFAPWIAEATIFVYNYARFDAAGLMTQIRNHGVTTFCAPPTVWRMLIQADLTGGPGTLREVVAAGEPLNPEVIHQVQQAWGMTLRDGFGQTETTCQVGNEPGSSVRLGSMGRPLPGVPVVLVDPISGTVREDEGELCLDLSAHPVNLMKRYRDEQRNAEAMAGGFYHSGDVAQRDQDGYLFYIGRNDDVFKASDYKVSPFEVESVLLEHPAVAEAAVVPAPDDLRLSVVKAYVALADGHAPDAATAESILAHSHARLAPHLRVRRLEFFPLPKTISGKIRRVELRQRERDEAPAVATTEFRIEQFESLNPPR